ncbi:hypothetical protein JCGZ_09373 [Jatropha curcas]|uniref:RNase H type-1 domain-containing protein n=1 Tax=Jatropha curcas TaxID=180498 RepID=A0A067KTT4_JATCU|nr:hypothetical protein JCGZ_09373 [Jatropha curcas]
MVKFNSDATVKEGIGVGLAFVARNDTSEVLATSLRRMRKLLSLEEANIEAASFATSRSGELAFSQVMLESAYLALINQLNNNFFPMLRVGN